MGGDALMTVTCSKCKYENHLNFCEHCGWVNEPVFLYGGTHWCDACYKAQKYE